MTTRTRRNPPRAFGGLTVTRTVTEHHPLIAAHDSSALSIGQLIDEHLAQAAQRGESIQSVRLDFDPEQWAEVATTVYCGFVEDYAA